MAGSLTAYWLGANDLHREGTFVNPSGQPFTYTNWMDGEPNDTTKVHTDNKNGNSQEGHIYTYHPFSIVS